MINTLHPQYKHLTKDQVQSINLLHISREAMLTAASNDLESAKTIYPLWLALEAALQRLWGFPENVRYVRTWEYPYCKCPKIDNEDRYPSGEYIVNSKCPIHGQDIKDENNKPK